jgi:hypothetical protein
MVSNPFRTNKDLLIVGERENSRKSHMLRCNLRVNMILQHSTIVGMHSSAVWMEFSTNPNQSLQVIRTTVWSMCRKKLCACDSVWITASLECYTCK